MMALGLSVSTERQTITSRKSSVRSVVVPLVTLMCICSVSADPDVTFEGGYCSSATSDPLTSKFYNNLDTVFHNLIQGIDVNTGRWHSQSHFDNDPDTAYGLATCTLPESYDDCKSCLTYIINSYFYTDACPVNSYGGQVTLRSCFLEYERYYVE